jgi:hypothetical protein
MVGHGFPVSRTGFATRHIGGEVWGVILSKPLRQAELKNAFHKLL